MLDILIKDLIEFFVVLFSILLNKYLIRIDKPIDDKIITLSDANNSNLINAELI